MAAGFTHLGIAPTWNFPQYNLENIDDFAVAIACGILEGV
jgi:hypothetical protein